MRLTGNALGGRSEELARKEIIFITIPTGNLHGSSKYASSSMVLDCLSPFPLHEHMNSKYGTHISAQVAQGSVDINETTVNKGLKWEPCTLF